MEFAELVEKEMTAIIPVCREDYVKIEKDEITIRDFTETDLPLMFKWLTDKRVLEYYEGRDGRFTMDTLSAHFLEEIPDGFRMIIEYKKSPIGYVN